MADQEQELARDLGFLEAYTMGLGTMIGAGIFVLSSISAANAGPASMVSFAIGGFVFLLANLSVEVSCSHAQGQRKLLLHQPFSERFLRD